MASDANWKTSENACAFAQLDLFIKFLFSLLLNSGNKQGQRSIGIHIFRLPWKQWRIERKQNRVRFMQLAICYSQLASALPIKLAYMVFLQASSNRFDFISISTFRLWFRVQFSSFQFSLIRCNVRLLLNNSCVTNSFLFFLHLPLWVSSYSLYFLLQINLICLETFCVCASSMFFDLFVRGACMHDFSGA